MRRVWIVLALALLASPTIAQADDEVKPEDLQKMYKDTLVQLKAAQDRKAELAARVADLEKQLQAANAQNDQLKRQTADFADKTYFLRSYYAAWLEFVSTRPKTKIDWDIFLNSDVPLTPANQVPFIDPEWPLSAKG
ncbi:MAG: hypothetical protein ABSF29_06790 [Tepidisphaeraceae bacterium]|jgi:hypothetical protein